MRYNCFYKSFIDPKPQKQEKQGEEEIIYIKKDIPKLKKRKLKYTINIHKRRGRGKKKM